MTKTELYEIAQALGKKLVTETDELKLHNAIGQAAVEYKVASVDLGQFQLFVSTAKHTYFVMGNQKLPSELADAQAKKSAPSPATLPKNSGPKNILPEAPPELKA